MSYGGRIIVLPGQGEAEEFSTLVHELAHEMLCKAERRTATTKPVRETEAEAIAFVIGKAIGLSTGRASADWISRFLALFISDMKMITPELGGERNSSNEKAKRDWPGIPALTRRPSLPAGKACWPWPANK